MNDRTEVKYFYSHILRLSAVLLLLICFSTTQSLAGATGNEKEKKANASNEKNKDKVTSESKEKIPENIFEEEPEINTKRPVSSGEYYQSTQVNDNPSSNGDDQNAVLSFNVIQYIFEQFKFSDQVY